MNGVHRASAEFCPSRFLYDGVPYDELQATPTGGSWPQAASMQQSLKPSGRSNISWLRSTRLTGDQQRAHWVHYGRRLNGWTRNMACCVSRSHAIRPGDLIAQVCHGPCMTAWAVALPAKRATFFGA